MSANGQPSVRRKDRMNKDERKQLYKAIEKRVLAGERKSEIYAEHPDEQDARLVARVLAQIPTPERRKRFSLLNWALIVGIGILAAIKLLVVTLLVLTEIPKGAVLILLAPAINIFLMWAVAKFRGVGYLLVIAFGLTGASKVIEGLEKGSHPLDLALNVTSLACVAASIAIAFVLMKKLLPQTSLFLTPKKDETGSPVFEE
jgi:hypothetical protein